MLCADPRSVETNSGPQLVGCGVCLNCRVNTRRQWTARLLLEAAATTNLHREVSWVTLTYADETLPYCSMGGSKPEPSLNTFHYQLCWKRLRKRVGAFRFFLVGEYGDETQRPHYHAIIYGPKTSAVEAGLQREWEPHFGHTRTRPLDMPESYSGRPAKDVAAARAAYCAHYCTKKMRGEIDDRMGYRVPEFARMSRRPGIGCTPSVLALHESKGGAFSISETGDVGRTVRIGGEIWPLAPTVRAWVRDQMEIPQRSGDRLPPRMSHTRQPTSSAYKKAAEQCAKMDRRLGAGRTL